jgi:hypothetical protein
MNKGLATALCISLALALVTMGGDQDVFGLASLVWAVCSVWLAVRVLMGKTV